MECRSVDAPVVGALLIILSGLCWPSTARELEVRIPDAVLEARANSRARLAIDAGIVEISGDGVETRRQLLDGVQRLAVHGSRMDDTLTVDLRGGLRPLEIDYAGGAGFDTLVIEGVGILDEVVYTPGPGNDEGVLSYRSGASELVVRFTGLEPVVDSTVAAMVTIVGTAANDGVSYSQGTDATWGIVSVGAFETYEFKNKTELRITCGDGDDDVFLSNGEVPTGMTTVIVQGEAGSDDFRVQAIPAGITASVEGGADSDFYWVGSFPQNMDTIQGTLTLDGGAHTVGTSVALTVSGTNNANQIGDFVRLLDSGNADPHSYVVDAGSVTRSGVTISLPNVEWLLLQTSAGAADVDILDTLEGQPVDVETQGGDDDIDVFDTGPDSNLRLTTAAGADTIDIHATGGDGGDTNSLGAFVVANAGPSPDTLTVHGTGAGSYIQLEGDTDSDQISLLTASSGGLVEMLGGSQTDLIDVGSSGGSLGAMLSTVEVDGGSNGAGTTTLTIGGVDNTLDSGDVLTVHDEGETGPVTYTFYLPWMTRTGAGTLNFASVETLAVNGGSGANSIGFESHGINNLFVTTQGGNDTVLVDHGSGGIQNIVFNTGGGADDVTVTGFNEPFIQVNAGPGDDTLAVVSEGGTNRRVQLNGDGGADDITVWRTPALGFVEVDGGDDSDTITLSGDGTATDGFLGALSGPVAVSGGAHSDTPTSSLSIGGDDNVLATGDILNLADRAPCACTYTITPASVDRTAIPTIDYDTIETLNLVMGADFNTVIVDGTGDATTTTVSTDLFVDTDVTINATGADSNLIVTLGSGADSVTLFDPGLDGDDADVLGAFVSLDGGGGSSDTLTWLGSPATFIGGPPGLILPPGDQRIAYTNFETETLNTADFGDAPDSYATLSASGGPAHGANGALFLGAAWDAESDGLPGPVADGDGADDDGVAFATDILMDADFTSGDLSLTASGSGVVNAWIDFNRDGDFDDADEQILSDSPVVAGVNLDSFSTPAAVAPGATFARFRLSSSGGLGPGGPAADGEVEDYRVTIRPVDSLDLSGRLESTTRSFWACIDILAGDVFMVLNGSDITLHAGSLIELRNGVTVESGAALTTLLGAVPGCP